MANKYPTWHSENPDTQRSREECGTRLPPSQIHSPAITAKPNVALPTRKEKAIYFLRSYGGIFITAMVAFYMLFTVGFAKTTNQADQRFIGTWMLVTSEFRTSAGKVTYPLGEKAVGILIYDRGGRMAAQLMKPDRPEFASGDMRGGTAEENKEAVEGYVAYFGRHEVNSMNGTVVHHVEASLSPNWLGQDQVLTLMTPPFLSGGQEITGVLVWKRLA